MSLSKDIRNQLIASFRAELAEHVQTMTDGLLAIEQHRNEGSPRQETLEKMFRAAHSLKGAARAIGGTAIEQVAHALEDVLDGLRQDTLETSPMLFTTCYKALDAIQGALAAYEAGETTPPIEALQAVAELAGFRGKDKSKLAPAQPEAVSQAAITQPLAEALTETALQQEQPGPAGKPPEQEVPEPTTRVEPKLQPAVASTGPAQPGFPISDETIRVSVTKLDGLMAQLSELLVTKIRAGQRLGQVRQFQGMVGQMQKDWLVTRSAYSRLARQDANGGIGALGKDIQQLMVYAGASQDQLRLMMALVNEMAREYANDTMHMSLVVDELEEEIKRVRMLPLSTITGPFARMVRDLAQESGKQVVLDIRGGETELDKRVLEQIKDPLVHMLRNAVDHGIELPDARTAAGKPACGTITLAAEQSGKDVIISVSDDGAGLDLPALRKSLTRRRGGTSVESTAAQHLSDSDLVEAIFQPGVSRRASVSGISGRGVGLDVVRRNVETLNGRIDLDWQVGKGATFRLTLPLGLSSSRGLLVRASGQTFAIPLTTVERILLVDRQEIVSLEGREAIRYEGRLVTVVRLRDILDLPPSQSGRGERIPVVVLAAAERRMAFAVDELVGEQEVVIKSLGKQLRKVGGIAGATVLGDGRVVLILNILDLFKLALQGTRRPAAMETESDAQPEEKFQAHILIVDDSITTRTLEKNILEAAGYKVQVAVDGQEALNAIVSGDLPSLVVSDIMMPRMNGFELTQRIKADPRLVQVPVILVSSLDSPEDKARGIDVGAEAYITKGQFDQNNLLEMIEQLI